VLSESSSKQWRKSTPARQLEEGVLAGCGITPLEEEEEEEEEDYLMFPEKQKEISPPPAHMRKRKNKKKQPVPVPESSYHSRILATANDSFESLGKSPRKRQTRRSSLDMTTSSPESRTRRPRRASLDMRAYYTENKMESHTSSLSQSPSKRRPGRHTTNKKESSPSSQQQQSPPKRPGRSSRRASLDMRTVNAEVSLSPRMICQRRQGRRASTSCISSIDVPLQVPRRQTSPLRSRNDERFMAVSPTKHKKSTTATASSSASAPPLSLLLVMPHRRPSPTTVRRIIPTDIDTPVVQPQRSKSPTTTTGTRRVHHSTRRRHRSVV